MIGFIYSSRNKMYFKKKCFKERKERKEKKIFQKLIYTTFFSLFTSNDEMDKFLF